MSRFLFVLIVSTFWMAGSAFVYDIYRLSDLKRLEEQRTSNASDAQVTTHYISTPSKEFFERFPWVPYGCKPKYCDPSPVFKVIDRKSESDAYELIAVITPANTNEYRELLRDSARSRLCTGSVNIHPNCSYLQEFVVDNYEDLPLKIIGIFDEGYGELYYSLRYAKITASGSKDADTNHDEDTYYLILGGFLCVLIIVTVVCVCSFCWCKLIRNRHNPSLPNSPVVQRHRNQETRRRWQNAAEAIRETHLSPKVGTKYAARTRTKPQQFANLVQMQMANQSRSDTRQGRETCRDTVRQTRGEVQLTGNIPGHTLTSLKNTMESYV